MEEEKYLGYIKYDGPLIEDGLMDGRRQAQALIGFDSAIRYFIGKLAPDLQNLDFEIPVRIRKGSWEALIPETVAGWTQAGLGVVATAYLTKAAQKMAEKDFSDFGFKDIFRASLDGVKWFARIGKHMGDVSIRKFSDVRFDSSKGLIGIVNAQGEILYVPKHMIEIYSQCPANILENIANNITYGRNLVIGSVEDDILDEVTIDNGEKYIFCQDEQEKENEILFPDLEHGTEVVLEGEVTRENKTSNSMGFKYNDHILTSYPEIGSIVQYKHLIFSECRLYGRVSRLDEKGRLSARRPKLIFRHLEKIRGDENYDLFNQ
ncbi:hypothetical protein HNO51_08775 [Billgrantia sulfidoxydans]|uniref:Uncharacterized protein n=1 Tax=Billgrantia sulfidoxydans TaxID=2733484 RepID=A0ABX7W4X1_9GAMM|nr:hypothetical protein [Halomonas sulfidoxydans]QTP54765.1 hypothetical protein HNO51_08775 [Halomonas sulfidoxydans]